ncbi:hypothetical protein Bbelb_237160 [Branchiostoma belcheri]|nr:hypothetical protein Bbelb_237160 [Branchiostoma belcheri]
MAENGNCSVEGGAGEESIEYRPQVFQCQGCREILADSLALNDPLTGPRACWEMSCLSFTAVSESVTVGEDLTTTNNKADKDYGCFYLVLSCSRCESEIGKMYKATLPEFDSLRNLFVISMDKVTNYDLGAGVSAPQCDLEAIVSAHVKMEKQMAKLRHVVLQLSERLTIFEQAVKEEDEEPDSKENILPADRKPVSRPNTNTPVVKQERSSSGTPSSRGRSHRTSQDRRHPSQNGYRSSSSSQDHRHPSQNGYRSPSSSRLHRRKKARIASISDSESD